MTRERSAQSLVEELAGRGIQLYPDDSGALRFRAPSATLTDADRSAIDRHREEIVALLEVQSESPLSDLQQSYLFGRSALIDLAGIPALQYLELSARDIDVGRLERALNTMIAGHPGLRGVVEGDTLMRHYAGRRYAIRVHERTSADDSTLRDEMMRAPRDPARWPLFDIRISRRDGEDDRLHLLIDLLLLDAFSTMRFVRQWLDMYENDIDAPEFPSLQPWEVRAQQVEDDEDRRWWQSRLDDLPGPPALPLVASPGEVTRPSIRRISARLSETHWSRVKGGAAAMKVTPASLLCAVFAETLEAWSGTAQETLITLMTFGRPGAEAEEEEVLGGFSDLLVLDCPSRRSAPSLAAHVGETHERLWQATAHCRYSGVKLLRELSQRRRLRGRLISPIVFTSMLFGDGEEGTGFSSAGFRTTCARSQTPQVALDYQVYEERGELVMSWDYVPDLLGTDAPQQAFDDYVAQLRRLAASDEWADIPPRPYMAAPARANGHRLGESKQAQGPELTGRSVEELSDIVRDCWAGVLGIAVPSDATSFFELGGTSLQAVSLQTSLERRLDAEVPIVFLFDNPTVTAQATRLAGGGESEEVGSRRFSNLRRRPRSDES